MAAVAAHVVRSVALILQKKRRRAVPCLAVGGSSTWKQSSDMRAVPYLGEEGFSTWKQSSDMR